MAEGRERAVNLWRIGEYSEVYAAHSEKEMLDYFLKLVGAEEAIEAVASMFERVSDNELDVEFEFDNDGERTRTTWRKLAADMDVPCQVSSSYV